MRLWRLDPSINTSTSTWTKLGWKKNGCADPTPGPSPYPANNSHPQKNAPLILELFSWASPSFYLSTWNTPPAWAGADSVDASAPDLKQQIAKTGMQPFFGYNSACLKKCLRSQNLHGFILKLTISGHFLRFQEIFILGTHGTHPWKQFPHSRWDDSSPSQRFKLSRDLSKNLVSTWLWLKLHNPTPTGWIMGR